MDRPKTHTPLAAKGSEGQHDYGQGDQSPILHDTLLDYLQGTVYPIVALLSNQMRKPRPSAKAKTAKVH
jgi:hypothetical protein